MNLDSPERYDYTIREIVKLEQAWIIATPENIVTILDEHGDEILPIWPHKEVADICILDEMKHDGWYVKNITLSVFLEKCIPDMDKSGVAFGVFFNKQRESYTVSAESLISDIEDEIEGEF